MIASNNTKKITKKVKELVETIKSMEGDKIIALLNAEMVSDNFDFMSYEKMDVLCESTQCLALYTKLLNVALASGFIIILQFTKNTLDGLPVKNMYGVTFFNKDMYPILDEELEETFYSVLEAEKMIDKDKNFVFCNLEKYMNMNG